MVTKEYTSPVLSRYGTVTKLTQWNGQEMVCTFGTYYSPTNSGLPASTDPLTGQPFTESEWDNFAAAYNCTIYLPGQWSGTRS